MSNLSGFPYFELQFNKVGHMVDANEASDVIQHIQQKSISDLMVISHGWNNNIKDARELYEQMAEKMRSVLQQPSFSKLPSRKVAILGIFWPSMKFTDRELIPGGAASVGSGQDEAAILEQLAELNTFLDNTAATNIIDQAKPLVNDLNKSSSAGQFADLIRSLLPKEDLEEADEFPNTFYTLSGAELIHKLGKRQLRPNDGTGGAASMSSLGNAARLVFNRVQGGARNLLNLVTYYQMKKRAGTIAQGLNPFLKKVREQYPTLHFHFVGHSFGARLITATAAGAYDLSIHSITLLQAAFSHNGFADNYSGDKDGFFRHVISEKRVSGPILISHTKNDGPVSIAYPIASRIARQVASGLGGKNDPYGGMGSNGAQKTPEAVNGKLLAVGNDYQFEAGRIYNLLADDYIKNHSDIKGEEVAYALLTGIERSL